MSVPESRVSISAGESSNDHSFCSDSQKEKQWESAKIILDGGHQSYNQCMRNLQKHDDNLEDEEYIQELEKSGIFLSAQKSSQFSRISNQSQEIQQISNNNNNISKQLKDHISSRLPVFLEEIDLQKSKTQWKLKDTSKDLKMYTYCNDQNEEICTRVEDIFNLPDGPEELINLIGDVNFKKKYDDMFEKGYQMDEDREENIKIQHWLLKGQVVVAQRHFSLISKQYKLSDTRTVIVAQGVEGGYEGEKDLPYSIKSAVRVELRNAGWVFDKLDGNNYRVIYMQCSNPNGKLPFFIKKTTPKFAADMVKKLKKLVQPKIKK